MSTQAFQEVYHRASNFGELLNPLEQNQVWLQVRHPERLLAFAEQLKPAEWAMVSVVGNDERELEDQCFKIYYILSHQGEDLFLTIEYPLEFGHTVYPSLYHLFPAVDPFEREMCDLLGLMPAAPRSSQVERGSWLHAAYPTDLYPLRRDLTTAQLVQILVTYTPRPQPVRSSPLAQGTRLFPVGPVHAGIIESGRFGFHIGGEAIQELDLQLGYKHKGIERIFQTQLNLHDGWRLAEQVASDSAVAHALAYCHAVETLAACEVPRPAQLLRALLLELERIYNHVGDIGTLVHDVAFDLVAAELACVREELVRLNDTVMGHRYLKGRIRPGGIQLVHPLNADLLRIRLRALTQRFGGWAERVLGMTSFRDRAIGTGVLSKTDANAVGAVGLTARASGIARDFRHLHPIGAFADPALRLRLLDPEQAHGVSPNAEFDESTAGDVYARCLTRLREVAHSTEFIEAVLDEWRELPDRNETDLTVPVHFKPEQNYTAALGFAEGWRGDVVYWVMQDKLDQIYRCKVRDPSVLNWQALRRALVPDPSRAGRAAAMLPDFPVINKSFNLSYTGNDL